MGPYSDVSVINPVSVKLRLPSPFRTHPVFHVSQLKPVIPGPLQDSQLQQTPLALLEMEGALAYRVRGSHLQYLVNWEGYGPEENSWVPGRDILNRSLIDDFHRSRPDHSAPRPRRRLSGFAPSLPQVRPCPPSSVSFGGGSTVMPGHPPTRTEHGSSDY